MSRLPDATPDPNAPSPEEREARIRELREKRHARLRKLGIRSAIGTGALLVAIVAFAYWLLTTIAGRDLLLAQIKARLPATASLEWKDAEGPASGPLTLHDVRFRWNKLAFDAKRVTLDPALRPLLGRRLRLDAMQVEGATLDLPPDDKPFELPRWPDALPQITVPLALQADDIRVDGLRITRQAAPLIDIRRLRGGLDVSNGYLSASHVAIDSDRGRIALHGTYAPRDRYRTDLVATALVPAKNARAPLRLGFVARGDLDAMNVALAGAAPGPVRVTLTLRGADRPRWNAIASAHGIDTAALGGTPVDPPVLTDVDFSAQGIGGDGRLQGRVVQGDTRIVVNPSVLHLEQQVLAFAPLDVELLGGRIVARGRGDFGERHNARIDYAIAARGLRWGEGASQISGDADITVAGTQTAWRIDGRSTLARGGRRAEVSLAGTGRNAQLTVQRLDARMPTGTLQANGRVTWRPALDWNLRATLAGVDPAYFVPGWPGALRGTLATTGTQPAGGALHATFDVPQVGGTLRGRRLGGSANVRLDDGTYRGVAALTVDRGRLVAQGEAGFAPRARWNVTGQLQAFDPSFFVAGWPGAVDAQLSSTGARVPTTPGQPDRLDATIDVPRLGGTLRGRALSGRGHAVVRGSDVQGDVQLAAGASRLEARGRIGARLDIDARLAPVQIADLLPDARGLVRGTLRVTGPRTAPDIAADLDGRDVAVGTYRVGALTAKGRLPWKAGTPGALALHGRGLQLGLPLDALDADLRGAVEALRLRADAHGPNGAVSVEGGLRKTGTDWLADIASLRLAPTRGAPWQLMRATQLRVGNGRVAVASTCLRSTAGELCGSADWPRRGADVTARGLPLPLILGYLPAREDGTPWLVDGTVDAQAQLRPVGGSWRGTAHVTSPQGGFRLDASQSSDLVRWRALDARVAFDPRRLQVDLTSGLFDRGRVQGRVAMGWAAHEPLSGNVAVDTDELTWMELFSPDIVEPRGRLNGRITLGGTRLAPQLGGQARLAGFSTELPALGIALTQGEATLDAQPDGNARITGRVRSGDGVLNIAGRLGWQGTGAPLELTLRGTNVQVANTRQLRAVANPDVVVRTSAGQPVSVTGTVVVPSALLMLERLDTAVKASRDVVVLDPAEPSGEVKSAAGIALDLALVAGNDVRLQGFGLDGRLGGRVQVQSAPGGATTARGRMDVSGRYLAYGQRLSISRGALTWTGGAISDPILDIRAERDVGDVTAGIDVTGRASAPRANVWSSTGATQSEALSLLALGRPLGSVGGEQGRQIGAASAALSAGGSLLASELGTRLGLDDAGVIESRTLGGSVLGIGKYLSPRLYVGYGVSLFGAGQVLTLKYLIRRGVDATFETSSVESRASLNYRKER